MNGSTLQTLTSPFAPPGSSDIAAFGLAYGDGYLWALGYSVNSGPRPLFKLNAATGAIVQTITSPFSFGGSADVVTLGLTYGDGYLWALGYSVNSGPRPLYKINPATGSIVQTLTTPFRPSGSSDVALFGLAYGGGYLWAFGYSVNGGPRPLYKINPANGSISQTLTTSFSGAGSTDVASFGLTYGGGHLWAFGYIVNGGSRPLKKISPASGALVQTLTTSLGSTDVFSFGLAYIEPVSITAQANPTSGGTATGGGSFNYGSSITIRATPSSCYTFANWTVNGSIVSTSSNYTFTATTNRSLVANFSLLAYTITTSSNPALGGTTTGSGSVNCGSSVAVCATINPGYTFTNWTENGTPVSTMACYNFQPGSNRALVANFVANPPLLPLILSSQKSGNYLVIAWSTNYPGFSLESSFNLASWSAVNLPVVVVADTYCISNPMTGAFKFFRLRK